jgi:hypothetical protein
MKYRSYLDVMIDEMTRQATKIHYCRFCGSQILHCTNDDPPKTEYVKRWELDNDAHYECFSKWREEQSKQPLIK